MKLEITKGTWRVERTSSENGDFQGRVLCDSHESSHTKPQVYIIAGECIRRNGGANIHVEANALLIAAAPELLEALKQTRQALMNCMSELQTHEQYRDNPDSICIKGGLIACNISDKAINKAKGL